MKKVIKRILNSIGYEIRKVNQNNSNPKLYSGLDKRPVGSMKFLLEDMKHRGLNCKTILDVGANRTIWSRMAKEIYPDAKFCLIEPQIEMKVELDKFCDEFDNSTYFLAGAGAKQDALTLTIWDDLQGSSFLPKPDNKLKEIGKQREIEIITIDNLINSSKFSVPELIKLDIQGFELEALKGAKQTFGITEAYILEVSLFSFGNMPILSDVINFMLERGYVTYDFPGFLRRPFDGALGQCDICFVKKDGFLRKSDKWE